MNLPNVHDDYRFVRRVCCLVCLDSEQAEWCCSEFLAHVSRHYCLERVVELLDAGVVRVHGGTY